LSLAEKAVCLLVKGDDAKDATVDEGTLAIPEIRIIRMSRGFGFDSLQALELYDMDPSSGPEFPLGFDPGLFQMEPKCD